MSWRATLRRFRTKLRQGDANNEDAHTHDRSEVLALEAKRAWENGDRDSFIRNAQRSLLEKPKQPDLLLLLSQRLVEMGRSDAALLSLTSLFELDRISIESYELLIEIVRVRKLPHSYLTHYLDELDVKLTRDVSRHRDALDILIPSRRVESIEKLTRSSDPIARRIAQIYFHERMGAEKRNALSLDDEDQAVVRYNLAIGRLSAAGTVLDNLTLDSYPINSLRRAIRRASAVNNEAQMKRLLKYYIAARPNDSWAVKRLEDIQKDELARPFTVASATDAQLLQRGFPFQAKRDREYERNDKGVFYLLHNSLPFASAGYATRTHGLLSSLNENWDVQAVTRPGFPFDLPNYKDLQEVDEDEIIDGVKYHRLTTEREVPKKKPITRYVHNYTESLVDYARNKKPAIVHAASNHWNGLAAVETARRLGLKSIYEVRGLWEVTRASREPAWRHELGYSYMARMETDAANEADQVIAITEGLRDEMIDRGVDGAKITVVPNGVDSQRFTPLERDNELAHELGLEDKVVIGYVGSLLDYEGLDLLLKAASKLAETRLDFHVLVVGDGAEKNKLEALASHLNLLGTYVTFTGRVPHHDVEKYYSLIDIAPFPRLPLPVCELVSPLKPFEAMAMEKAIIVSNVRALTEIVDDGVLGLVHEKGSVESLATQIETLLDDATLRESLAGAAREWVIRERDWKVLSARVANIYEQLLTVDS